MSLENLLSTTISLFFQVESCILLTSVHNISFAKPGVGVQSDPKRGQLSTTPPKRAAQSWTWIFKTVSSATRFIVVVNGWWYRHQTQTTHILSASWTSLLVYTRCSRPWTKYWGHNEKKACSCPQWSHSLLRGMAPRMNLRRCNMFWKRFQSQTFGVRIGKRDKFLLFAVGSWWRMSQKAFKRSLQVVL